MPGVIESEWMPYQIGDSLLRLPTPHESALTLEQLAKDATVYRSGKMSHFVKAKLSDYRRRETSENVITHVQEKQGRTIYFLKTYGLESWTIEV